MAKRIIAKRCCRCKESRPLSDFTNPKGSRMLCAKCRAERPSQNTNHYIDVVCKDCGTIRRQRSDTVKKYPAGLCRSCATSRQVSRPDIMPQRIARRLQTIADWSDEKKAAYAEHARQQVIQQGGVPNAKPFVREGKEGRRMAGETHYAWKGGVTPENQRERSSGKYAEWRTAILRRDNFTCQLCGIRGGRLQADHILSWATHKELRFELSNGRTLCVPCHKKTPNYGWHGRGHVLK